MFILLEITFKIVSTLTFYFYIHLIGNMTKHLCDAFPNAKITGIDSSPNMIEAARSEYRYYSTDSRYADRVDFKLDTIENYVLNNGSKKFDIVYSNATIHWIPTAYHAVLFPQIIRNVMKKNNSILAVQMPDTKNQQSHLLMETGKIILFQALSDLFVLNLLSSDTTFDQSHFRANNRPRLLNSNLVLT